MDSVNNNVNRKESEGCVPGCSVFAGVTLFVVLFGILSFIDSMSNKRDVKRQPVTGIDTCARIKDSMCVYKIR